jgi:MFS transporter, DHA3 family, macrolide efflux protein
MEQRVSKFGVLAEPTFRHLFIAQFASQLGSMIGITAFTFYLLEHFGDQPSYATISEMMISLPTLAVFFIVGVLADRMDRQKIASNSDLISAALTLVLLATIQTNWMPLIFAVMFLRSAVGKFFFPAQGALVQGVLPKDQQVSAAGLNQTSVSILILFGNTIGAACYWTFGVEGALLVDAISYLASAWLIRRCRIAEDVRLPNGRSKWSDLKMRTVWSDLKAGAVYIWNFPVLLRLIIGLMIVGLCVGGMSVMPIFMLKYKLAPDNYEQMSALLGIFSGVGILLGSPLATWMAKKMKLYNLLAWGFFLGGLAYAACAFSPNVWVFMTWEFLFGLTVPLVNVAFFGWMAQIVDVKMMGRVQGFRIPAMTVAQGLSLLLIAAVFPKWLSVTAAFLIMGGLLVITAVYKWLSLPALARKLEAETADVPLSNAQAENSVS